MRTNVKDGSPKKLPPLEAVLKTRTAAGQLRIAPIAVGFLSDLSPACSKNQSTQLSSFATVAANSLGTASDRNIEAVRKSKIVHLQSANCSVWRCCCFK